MMDLTHKILAGTVAVLLVCGVIGFRSWLDEHDSRLKVEAEVTATKTAIDKLQADRNAERQAETDRDRQRDTMNAQTLAEVAKLKTPAQVSGYVNREVPGAQAVVSTPAVAPGSKPDAPAPKPVVTLDAGALDTRLAKCKVSETSLSTCQQDLAGRARDAAAADKQMELLKKDNNDLQTELKGGRFWTRAKRAGKWSGIGAAAAVAALCALGHCK